MSTETVYCDEIGKNVNKVTFRSKINGKEITMLSNGYANNGGVVYTDYLYYMSSSLNTYAYCAVLHNNPSMRTISSNRYSGFNIRPVLKEQYTYTDVNRDIQLMASNALRENG